MVVSHLDDQLLENIPMSPKNIFQPGLTQEDIATRRRDLLAAIKATIQAGQVGRPLSEEEHLELDKDLEDLKNRYQQWCRIENKIAPSLPELKEQIRQLEKSVKGILDVLGKPNTLIAALLLNNIDKDCHLLEPDQPLWTSRTPLTVKEIQWPYPGNPDDPDDPADLDRNVVSYEITMNEDPTAVSLGLDAGELDINLNRFEMSVDDDPLHYSVEVKNMREAIIFNLDIFHSGIKQANRQVDRLEIYKKDDVYSGVTGGRDRLLIKECSDFLKKYIKVPKHSEQVCLANLWAVVKPWVADELDEKGFKTRAKKLAKDFLAFCEAHLEKEKLVDKAHLSEVPDAESIDVCSDPCNNSESSSPSDSCCLSFSKSMEELARLDSRRFRAPRKETAETTTMPKIRSSKTVEKLIPKPGLLEQDGGKNNVYNTKVDNDATSPISFADEFLKHDWGINSLDE